jgi:hypothetical protein
MILVAIEMTFSELYDLFQMFNVAIVMIWRICEDETHFAAKMRFKLDICSVSDVIAVNDLLALAAEIYISLCFPFHVSCHPEHQRNEISVQTMEIYQVSYSHYPHMCRTTLMNWRHKLW